MLDGQRAVVGRESGAVVARLTPKVSQLGLEVDRNLGLGFDLGDEVGQSLLGVGRLPVGRVAGLVADVAPLAPQVVLALDEMDGDVEASQL